MKLIEILKKYGLFSNDIRQRLKNGQISINGIQIKENINLDILVDNNNNIRIIESGNFISKLLLSGKKYLLPFKEQLNIFGFENLFETNIDNTLTQFLDQYLFIKISKKESFLLEKKS